MRIIKKERNLLNMRKFLSCLLAVLMLCAPLSASALCGDVDDNGERNAVDYMKVKRCVLGTFPAERRFETDADVDQNGTVDTVDYMMLKRCVLGTFDLPAHPQIKNDQEWTLLTQMLASVNAEREKHGLQPLVLSAELCVVAYDKSSDMVQNGYFDHVSPIYGEPADMLESYGVHFYAAGENIAAGQRSVREVMDAWMNSHSHRANILNPTYTEMGLGIAYGGEHGIYWTLLLCQSR